MPFPFIAGAGGAAGLGLLYRYLSGSGDPALTPAPTTPNVGQQSQNVAATGVEMGPPTPTPEQFAQMARLQNQNRAPASAPVATPGEAADAATAQQTNEDVADRLRAMQANNPQAAEPTDDPDADRNRRLAQFGFAMAASRNPSLFGMIGEAGLAMQRGNREEREDDRRDREVDATAEYRQAQIALARAEAAYNQDPNNPRNQALLAQARYQMSRAAGGGGGGGGDGASRISGQIIGDDGVLYGVTRDGRAVPYTMPDGTPLRRGQTENWQAQYTTAYNAAMNRLSALGSPSAALPEEERDRLARAAADRVIIGARQALSRPGQPAQTTQPQTGVAPPARTRYDAMGRPITQ